MATALQNQNGLTPAGVGWGGVRGYSRTLSRDVDSGGGSGNGGDSWYGGSGET